MNIYPLLGILAIAYGVFVFYIAMSKMPAIWNMKKIEGFKKVLGEKGTVIFFYIWGVAFAAVGIWLIIN